MNYLNRLGFSIDENSANMWHMINELFPIYRTLIGPGFLKSLEIINKSLPLNVSGCPTGMEVLDWVIPKGFKVNEAWVDNPLGNRIIDYSKHPYAI